MAGISENEEEILKFWKEKKVFEKSLEKTKKGKPYIFYDGPPFATGTPHHGHILGSVTKDVYGRFWTMQGRYVRRVWGWDCHGLPIENIAEKGLGINSKDEIEKMGVKKFNDYCRSKVLGYTAEWKKVIDRIGRWVDMETAYKTMDNEYIESVWWAFKQLHEKGYIYEGERILMYCPRCSTPLAKAEVAMDNSYKNVKDETVVIKFKLKDEEGYALAWTTTPWTLPSNLALTVNPKMVYCYLRDRKDSNVYLLAKELIGKFYKTDEEYNIIKEVSGKELEGKEFEPLFDYFKDTPGAFKIILGDFVTAEDGTGIVHTAPAFGEEDYEICKKYKIPLVQPVDEKGRFTSEVKDFAGKFIHDTNREIIDFLKKQGKVVLIKKVEHEYPFCYRCDTKLMYRAIPAWFINIQKIKPRLLKLNKKLNWYPDFLKDGRAKYIIETAPDWNVSRNRYWATAMPIWKSSDGDFIIIGSIEELKKYSKTKLKEIDLHKDFLDEVILVKDGKEYKRIPEVLDCWFESGSMTFAQFHYPFENKELFKKSFPAQFVAEYIAQVRAWFYYMLVLSAILFDDVPFENVVTTGTILAEDGQKMSKSKNNFTDPMELVGKYGADSLRFYLVGSPLMNAENVNFSNKGLEEIYKKVMVLIYNVNKFYSLYPEIKVNKTLKLDNLLDKWIISRLNQFNLDVEKNLKDYNTIKACENIKIFVDDLSTWYVRRSRERFNEGDSNAKTVLNEVLSRTARIIAPIMPFTAEIIYKNIGEKNSVHLENWPEADKKKISSETNVEMKKVRALVSLSLKERDKAHISLKQPLANLFVSGYPIKKEYLYIILDELNVKNVVFDDKEEWNIEFDLNITPQLEEEGVVREFCRNIQAERKNVGMKKEDRIKLKLNCNDDLMTIFKKNIDFIKSRINAKEIIFADDKTPEMDKSFKIKEKNIFLFFVIV